MNPETQIFISQMVMFLAIAIPVGVLIMYKYKKSEKEKGKEVLTFLDPTVAKTKDAKDKQPLEVIDGLASKGIKVSFLAVMFMRKWPQHQRKIYWAFILFEAILLTATVIFLVQWKQNLAKEAAECFIPGFGTLDEWTNQTFNIVIENMSN